MQVQKQLVAALRQLRTHGERQIINAPEASTR